MTLHIYDFEFNRLASENHIIQARWTLYYNEIGSFEVHLPLTSCLVETVTNNRYIVAVQGSFSAIIIGYELMDELVLYGRTCNWILTKRIAPQVEETSAPGKYVSELVATAFSDTDIFKVSEPKESESIKLVHSAGQLSDTVMDFLRQGGLGHEVVFDIKSKKWIFNTTKGTENKIILSEGHKNAYDTRGSFDILELATCGAYYDSSDGNLKEVVKDAEKTGIYRWQAYITADADTEAMAELETMDEKNEITAKLRGLEFGKDYAPGDTVRIQIIKGKYRNTRSVRIKGAEIRLEQGKYTQQPIFE